MTTIDILFEGSLWLLAGLGLYLALIRKAKPVYRRYYLMALSILPWVLPFFHYQVVQIPVPVGELNLQEVIVQSSSSAASEGMNWTVWILGLYSLGFSIALGRLVYSILRFLILRRRFTLVDQQGAYSLYHTHGLLPDSSFFKALYMDETKSRSHEEAELIKRHELAHIQQGHSWDRVLIELQLIIFWFHPLVYLIRKELLSVHEFLADRNAVEEGSRRSYQNLLLQEGLSTDVVLIHSFHSGSMKRRILELQKKYLALHPFFLISLVLALVFFGKSFQTQKEVYPEIEESIEVTEVAQLLNIRELQEAIGYPKAAKEQGIEGMVITRVLVDKYGDVIKFEVIKSSNEILHKAVTDKINHLKFKPAQYEGEELSMWVNIPFNFKIQKEEGNN